MEPTLPIFDVSAVDAADVFSATIAGADHQVRASIFALLWQGE